MQPESGEATKPVTRKNSRLNAVLRGEQFLLGGELGETFFDRQ
jgi:hypothetical protein